jgi:hypothetical protein
MARHLARTALALGPLVTLAPLAARAQDDAAGAVLVAADSVRLTLAGYLQADGRLARGPLPGSNGVLLRRARLTFDLAGRGGWALRLQPDFGQGRAQIQDGYVGWTRRRVAARAGRFRPAYGVERSLSSATLLFPERGLVNPFMPSRLFGAQVAWAGPRLTVSAGGFEAAGVRDALVDTDGDPVGVAQAGADGVVRAVWRPWAPRPPRGPDDAGGPPRVEVQAAGMVGRYRGRDAEFRGVERFLTPAQRPALALDGGAADDGSDAVFADGVRRRGSLGAQVVAGPVHVLAEGAWFAQGRAPRAGGRSRRSGAARPRRVAAARRVARGRGPHGGAGRAPAPAGRGAGGGRPRRRRPVRRGRSGVRRIGRGGTCARVRRGGGRVGAPAGHTRGHERGRHARARRRTHGRHRDRPRGARAAGVLRRPRRPARASGTGVRAV